MIVLTLHVPRAGICHQHVDTQPFVLPDFFQVIQNVENIAWQGRAVRIVMVQSEMSIEQLTEKLAERLPFGSMLTKANVSLQFSWSDQTTSHLLELVPQSKKMVQGMYSTVSLLPVKNAACHDKTPIPELFTENDKRVFQFIDTSLASEGIHISAFRSKLSPSQISVQLTRRLKDHHWIVLNRYSNSLYEHAWTSLEAVLDKRRIYIQILPDSVETTFLMMSAGPCR